MKEKKSRSYASGISEKLALLKMDQQLAKGKSINIPSLGISIKVDKPKK